MKIIVKESQIKQIQEISTFRGTHITDPSYEKLFVFFDRETEFPKWIEKYLKKVLGFKIKDVNIADYIDYLTNGRGDDYHIPKELKKVDVKSNLAYFLAKNFGGLKKLGNLEALPMFGDGDNIMYYFFDPELEESIGYIGVTKPYGGKFQESIIKIPKGSKSVYESSVDKEVRGSGVGKEMYLSILEEVPILFCDSILSQSSLNIWVNVLPRFVYTGAIVEMDYKYNYKTIIKQITPKTKIMDHEDVYVYFATKNPSLMEKMTRQSET